MAAQRNMLSSSELKEQPVGWESFVNLWERANFVRTFFWNQQITDEKILLKHFLARLRRFFGVDFCLGFLSVSDQKLVEVALPEATVNLLSSNFSQRCLSLVAKSRAPITWDEVNGFGFQSTVVAPLAPPVGGSFGFLMMGHSSRKSYSSAELFLLQALATELSWVVRNLAARRKYRQQVAAMSHDVKNALQVIIGNIALLCHKMTGAPNSDEEKYVQHVESGAQQILDRINDLSAVSMTEDGEFEPRVEMLVDVAGAFGQSVVSSRRVATERGVTIEVVYTPKAPGDAKLDRPMFSAFLDALVHNAALATRSEAIRLTVRRNPAGLQLRVRGMELNQVAEKLQSLFASAPRGAGAPEERDEALTQARQYLDNGGGDVYLESRPGATAEFIVCFPLEGSAQAGRQKLENKFGTKVMV